MKTNMKISFLTACLLGLLLMGGCKTPENPKPETPKPETQLTNFDLEAARSEIDQANREFVDFFSRNDSIGLANMFTVDGKSMEPNMPSFNGRKAVQTHYAMVMRGGANQVGLVTTGLWGDEKMLAEEGEYTFMNKDGRQIDRGKYLCLWKKEEGKWKLFRDCYNSDLPAGN